MDFYGPRVPIGGGALYGKDFRHIDRLAATAAREAALEAVKAGARECKVTLAYEPNGDVPLDVVYEIELAPGATGPRQRHLGRSGSAPGRIPQKPREAFAHSVLRGRGGAMERRLAIGLAAEHKCETRFKCDSTRTASS